LESSIIIQPKKFLNWYSKVNLMKENILFLFLGLYCLFPKSFAQNHIDENATTRILSHKIDSILTDTGIPSISISLIKGDSVVWSEAFGYTNVKKKIPATSSSIYSTGSNFKFVTATAVMQLAEAGKLKLDDPVNKYLGKAAVADLSAEGNPVTFRHLLSHHSGLKGPIEIVPLWERRVPKDLDSIAAQISAAELPGTEYQYCNHCYALVGLAIERISGQSFEDYIKMNILRPLGIKSQGPVVPTPEMVEELALPYSLKNRQAVPEYQSRFDVFPAGDIYLRSDEMARFLLAQLNSGSYNGKPILNKASIVEMQTPQFGSNYGLGTRVFKKGDKKYLYHTGQVPGFSTYFELETSTKTGVYLAANADKVQDILAEVATLSLDLLIHHLP
jgi:serine-type D-Ala-D-Ala carboxypeptidase/endopeptidase